MTLLLDFLFSKEVRGRWGENSSCLGFDARRRSRDNPWATPSILHAENEKQTLSFSLRLLVCVSFGIVGRLVVTEDPANPNQVYKAQPRDPPPPLHLYSPRHRHPASAPTPSQHNCLTAGFRSVHCVNLNCTSHKSLFQVMC